MIKPYKALIITGLVITASLGTATALNQINQNHVVAKAGDIPFATGQTKIVPNVTPQSSVKSTALQNPNYPVQTAAGDANQFYGATITPVAQSCGLTPVSACKVVQDSNL